MKMAWSRELVITLIELYRERPVLWDQTTPDYKDKNKKNDAWNEISEEIKINKAEIQTKMRNLTTQFYKELKKAKSGSEAKWFAFDHLQFMKANRRSRDSGAVKTNEQTAFPNNIPSLELSEDTSPSSSQTYEPTAFRNNVPSIELAEERIPSSSQHQIQLIQDQLDQQCRQTQLALQQVQFLSDQMVTECAARRKAQTNEQSAFHNNIPSMELAEERIPSSAQHQIQLLKYQLDQQCQHTQNALLHVQFLSDQKETESAARRKAEEQINQLMSQNKELLNHIEKLFKQNEDLAKQIRVLEHDKRSKISYQEPQALRPPQFTAIRIESVGTASCANDTIEIKLEDD